MLESVPFAVLAAVLFACAIPLGGEPSWFVNGATFCVSSGLALALIQKSANPSFRLVRRAWRGWPLWAFLALLAAQDAYWCLQSGSAGRHDAGVSLSRTCLYASAGWLALLVTSTRERVIWIASTTLAAGVVQTALGVGLLSANERVSMLGMQLMQGARACGTFVNADHFANYLLLAFGMGIGLMFAMEPIRPAANTLRAKVSDALAFLLSARMLVRLALIVLVIGVVLSRSRMGNGALLAGLFGATVVAWQAWPDKRGTMSVLVASILLVDLLIIGQWVGLDKVVARMERTDLINKRWNVTESNSTDPQEETLEERIRTGRDAFAMAMAAPWVGHGSGSFGSKFPRYKAADGLPRWVDHAHNDYAQFAAERGLPMLAAGLLMCACTMVRLWRLMRQGQAKHSQGMAAGLCLVLITMGLHAMVDFNLQTPANALTFTVMLALAWALPDKQSR